MRLLLRELSSNLLKASLLEAEAVNEWLCIPYHPLKLCLMMQILYISGSFLSMLSHLRSSDDPSLISLIDGYK